MLDTAPVKGKCRKLSPSWKGPGIILKRLSPYLYRVKTKTAVMVANHDRLKKCNDRDIPLWLARYQEKFVSGEGSQHGGSDGNCGAQGPSSQDEGAAPVKGPDESDDGQSKPVRHRGVLRSIVIRQVRHLMGPTDVRAGPRGPASHPLIQPRSRRKPQQTQSFIASVIALMMDD